MVEDDLTKSHMLILCDCESAGCPQSSLSCLLDTRESSLVMEIEAYRIAYHLKLSQSFELAMLNVCRPRQEKDTSGPKCRVTSVRIKSLDVPMLCQVISSRKLNFKLSTRVG